ncbi:MAG TPA: dioxygenase [Streptosporangiaceae bacterium]|nr:dioxygenase [Streptosporangiaceae bacterium]
MPYVTEKNLTDIVLDRWSKVPDPRLRQIMTSLIKHLHSFVREIEPTEAEWFTAIDWLTRTGKLSTDKRQEFILTSDVLGISMLIDAINHRFASKATPTTVTGPFHIHDSPEFSDGADMAQGAPGIACFVHGKVTDMDGRPVGNVMLDVWQTDGEGLYEAQRPELTDTWMRGIYHSKSDGSYLIRTVAPIGYTIPLDGTVGEVFARNNVSPYRPAHIHFMIKAPGFHAVTTHLFQHGDQYIETDVVYGVKEPLIVEFEERPAGRKAPNGEILNEPFYEVRYDFTLPRLAQAAAA